jgi:hypothetical protein
MSRPDLVLAKAVNPAARSEAIVVSFGSEWYASLRSGRFTAVIRKRVPASTQPHWLYFHINSPKSAICARADILAVEKIDRSKALQIKRELDLSEDRILDYFGRRESMGCYRLGKISYPDREVTSGQIVEHMVYYPPQSFFVLSKHGKELLDRLCGFRENMNDKPEASRT